MYRIYKYFQRFGFNQKTIYNFAIVTFLYAIINGITTFVMPVFVNNHVKSLSLVGLILASSSIGNISTDFIVNFLKKSPSYLVIMRVVGVFTLLGFLLMWVPTNLVSLFLLAIIWGIYTELFSFAKFDYVASIKNKAEHAFDHGLLNNFFSIGSVIAPLIAGSMILISLNLTLMTGVMFVLLMAYVFSFFKNKKRFPLPFLIVRRNLKVKTEIKIWEKVGFKIMPLLAVLFVFGMSEAAILSFTPIFTESREGLKIYAGLILAAFYIPTILFSTIVGKLVDKNGEKKFILLGLILGGISLLFFGYSQSFSLAFIFAFLHGLGMSMFAVALSSEESKYIERHHCQEGRVVGESGISYNIGFILGAIGAGFLASKYDFGRAFMVFGMAYFVAMIVYWFWGPRGRSLKDGEVR